MNIELDKRENKFLFQKTVDREKYPKKRAIIPLSRFRKKLSSEKKEFIAFSFYSCHRVTNKSLLVQLKHVNSRIIRGFTEGTCNRSNI